MEKRFRIIYPDNGAQFMEAALSPYMPFLVAPGEDPSVLINRGVHRPRGGGHIENILGQLNTYLKLRPGYINEKRYRQSYKKLNKVEPPLFQDVVDNTDAFMNSWNHDRVDGEPSCYDKLMSGPDLSLSMPSPENMAVFAFTTRLEKRKADPGGFNLDDKRYSPFRDDPQLYKGLANAAAASKDILLLVSEIGDYKMVSFSLDGGETYELAIEKEQKGLTQTAHTQLMRAAERAIAEQGNEAAALAKTLLRSTEQPLVINGLRKQPRFQQHDGSPYTVDPSDPTRSQGPQFTMPIDVPTQASVDPNVTDTGNAVQEPSKATGKRQKGRVAGKPKEVKLNKEQGQSQPPAQASQQQTGQVWSADPSTSASAEEPDDTEEFLKQLRAALGKTGS